jgi:3-methyl-2-oxobutanoate hydroxymethyltransferase
MKNGDHMARIYTYGGEYAERNHTVASLRAGKGTRKFSQASATTTEQAVAVAEAGIDLLSITTQDVQMVRSACPNTFITAALMLTDHPTDDDLLRNGFAAMEAGADALYTIRGLSAVELLAEKGIPVMGHAGLVPRFSTWTGGLRAVGKTADDALGILEDCRRLEDAGAFAVEMEVVASEALAEITSRTSLLTSSIGAGPAGDIIFLFTEDITGENPNPPRHVRQYGHLRQTMDQVHRESVDALRSFHQDVITSQFPGPGESVSMANGEVAKLQQQLESSTMNRGT